MPKSQFTRTFRKSFKIHSALQSAEAAAAPGEYIDAAKVASELRGQDPKDNTTQSEGELNELIARAASDVGVPLKHSG